MMEWTALLLFGPVCILVLYLLEVKNKKDFESEGIPYLGNGIYRFFYNSWKGIGFVEDFKVQYLRLRKLRNVRFAGGYDLGQKSILLVDPIVIKSVLVKDFDHFVDRRVGQMPQGDYLWARMLVSLRGSKWKAMRSAVTPALTTGKIKLLFPLFQESGRKLVNFFENEIKAGSPKNEGIDLTNGFSKFTMDIIFATVVGLDSKAFDQRSPSIFEVMGKKMEVRFKWFQFLTVVGLFLPTKISSMLGLSLFGEKVQSFFTTIVKSSIAQRELENGEQRNRNDFIQLMLAARDGKLRSDDDRDQLNNNHLESAELASILDELGITANCALFISDGFNTIQSLLLFCTYALALNQDVQERLRKEVDAVFEENGGQLPYDAVQGMVYLDMVVNEAMRLYPPAGLIDRCCTKDYKIPGTDITLEKGSGVSIAINGLHHDPEYYPEPSQFNPERFSPKNRNKIIPYTFMPFGEGPRSCIGMRFAMADVKVGISEMVHHFKIEPNRKTLIPMKYKDTVVLTPDGGMYLSLTKLENKASLNTTTAKELNSTS